MVATAAVRRLQTFPPSLQKGEVRITHTCHSRRIREWLVVITRHVASQPVPKEEHLRRKRDRSITTNNKKPV
jgi:hypothetical protein